MKNGGIYVRSMACIFSASDEILIDYLAKIITEQGLQPFVYKQHVRSFGFSHPTIGGSSNDPLHRHNEQRIMLAFPETISGEAILADIATDIPGFSA